VLPNSCRPRAFPLLEAWPPSAAAGHRGTAPRIDAARTARSAASRLVASASGVADAGSAEGRGARAAEGRIPTGSTGDVRIVRAASSVRGIGGGRHAAGARHGVERELPLVVAGLSTVRAQRGFLALAADAHDAADCELSRHARLRSIGGTALAARCESWRLLSWPWSLSTWARHTRSRATGGHHDEFPVLRHWILVFLAQEPLLHKQINTGRQDHAALPLLPHLEPVERDRARVLLAAPHQLSFLLPTGLLTPDRHRDRHQDRHDGQRHEQGRHRVTPLAEDPRALTT
jgi:hypothetical protein